MSTTGNEVVAHKIIERIEVPPDSNQWGPLVRIDWLCACGFGSSVNSRRGHQPATHERVDSAFRQHARTGAAK